MIVLGCGPSGKEWGGHGFSIGVNDCLKFGKGVNALVCVNSDFTPERMKIIRETVAQNGFYSQLRFWCTHPDFIKLETRTFKHTIEPGVVYHSRTSPFIAISLAVTLGHKEITLYGVDFDNHPIMKDDTLSREVDTYMRFIEHLKPLGVTVNLGVDTGAFKGLVPAMCLSGLKESSAKRLFVGSNPIIAS